MLGAELTQPDAPDRILAGIEALEVLVCLENVDSVVAIVPAAAASIGLDAVEVGDGPVTPEIVQVEAIPPAPRSIVEVVVVLRELKLGARAAIPLGVLEDRQRNEARAWRFDGHVQAPQLTLGRGHDDGQIAEVIEAVCQPVESPLEFRL